MGRNRLWGKVEVSRLEERTQGIQFYLSEAEEILHIEAVLLGSE